MPNLRFPEFENAGEWEEKVISQLGETVNGLNGKKGEDFGRGEPFVQYKQVFDKSYIDFSNCGKVEVKRGEIQNKLQKGDILFTTSSETPNEVGFASVVISQPGKDTYLNSFCFILRPYDIEKILPSFSKYFFHCPIYRKFVTKIAQGSTRFNLSKNAFLRLKLPLPIPKEQQKIADCLSSLDELITSHTQKHEALQSYKKGLMQSLFPNSSPSDKRKYPEGGRGLVPELRFPEFENAGEWNRKTLGKIGKVSMCKRILKGETKTKGDIPFYKIGTFGKQADAYIDRNIFETYRKKYSYPSKDEILISASGTIGRLVVFNGEDAYFQDSNIVWIKNNEKLVINKFLFYCYSNIKWATDDNTIARLYNDNLRGMKIIIPFIPEQQKIADCLSSLDGLIAAQAQKIEDLKDHKKGLMQQLFPAMSEVRA